MKARILALTALAGASLNGTLAFADAVSARTFNGLSLGADVKLVTNTLAVIDWINPVFGSGIGTLNSNGGNETIPDITAGYSFPLGDDGLLGIGGTFDLVKSKLLRDPQGAFIGVPFRDIEQKNHYSMYLEPGFRIGGATQLYAKVAYHAFTLHDPNTALATTDQTYSGVGIGAGLKTTFSANWAVMVEIEQINYSPKLDNNVNEGGNPVGSLKPKTTSGLVGIQYTFDATGL